MAGLLNPNRAKIHRNYTVEEVASLFDAHKNTVRNWIKKGLPVCDDQRPALILGSELREYLQAQRKVNKQKCKPYEMYCMRCRSPQRPAENMVDYEPITASTGRLIGLCSCCEGIINKYASLTGLSKIIDELDVSLPSTVKHINKMTKPLLNCDLTNRG